MDNIDRLNDAVTEIVTNWRNVFTFIAAVFVLWTFLEIAGDSKTGLVIIAWIVVAGLAVLFYYPRKGTKKEGA